ncbi:MAG: hypothetical protein ACTSU2_03450 [Promethearchaeota archaeon]
MVEIKKVLESLSEIRPIFHSERDFQFAFAWQLKKLYNNLDVRLEKRFDILNKPYYVDIFAKTNKDFIIFELKYFTQNFKIAYNGEDYNLKYQSAEDIGRYDYLKDVMRIETIVENSDMINLTGIGYAIALTNNPGFWKPSRKEEVIDKDFRIDEKRGNIGGKLTWKNNPSEGTTNGRNEPIILKRRYILKWNEFSDLGGKYGRFRYLALKITQT